MSNNANRSLKTHKARVNRIESNEADRQVFLHDWFDTVCPVIEDEPLDVLQISGNLYNPEEGYNHE